MDIDSNFRSELRMRLRSSVVLMRSDSVNPSRGPRMAASVIGSSTLRV